MSVSIKVKVTIPEIVIRSDVVRHKLAQRQRLDTGPDLRRDFLKTTVGWKWKRPTFQQNQAIGRDFVAIRVFTESERYALVTKGSRPHLIRPRKTFRLRFQTGYRAATRPRILSSKAPHRFGPHVTARAVRHPGFTGRDFDLEVAERNMEKFARDMQDELNWIARSK